MQQILLERSLCLLIQHKGATCVYGAARQSHVVLIKKSVDDNCGWCLISLCTACKSFFTQKHPTVLWGRLAC